MQCFLKKCHKFQWKHFFFHRLNILCAEMSFFFFLVKTNWEKKEHQQFYYLLISELKFTHQHFRCTISVDHSEVCPLIIAKSIIIICLDNCN